MHPGYGAMERTLESSSFLSLPTKTKRIRPTHALLLSREDAIRKASSIGDRRLEVNRHWANLGGGGKEGVLALLAP